MLYKWKNKQKKKKKKKPGQHHIRLQHGSLNILNLLLRPTIQKKIPFKIFAQVPVVPSVQAWGVLLIPSPTSTWNGRPLIKNSVSKTWKFVA